MVGDAAAVVDAAAVEDAVADVADAADAAAEAVYPAFINAHPPICRCPTLPVPVTCARHFDDEPPCVSA